MKKFLSSIALLIILLAVPVAVTAATNSEALCTGSGGTWTADSSAPSGGTCTTPGDNRSVMGTIQQVTDVFVFATGAIAVIMLIVGGIRYATSAGEQSAVSGAKNTIMYAIVGLVVAAVAYTVVHFIISVFNLK